MPKIFEHPFFGRGFRPFFFLGALYSVISLVLWGTFYAGYHTLPTFHLNPVSWHAHEMIYGFSLAIIAGFLLTAVANWTGHPPLRQRYLASLCGLWGLGRIAMNVDMGLPIWAITIIETLFTPALAIALSIPLFRSWNKRNFIFLALLSILFICDIWFMLSTDRTPLYMALMMIIIMISLIGGRIIPAFTVAALNRKGTIVHQTPQMKMDAAALLSLITTALCLIFAQGTTVLTLCAGIAAIIHVLRLRHYHSLKTLSDPMLWILHMGYVWLIVGLGLLALSGLNLLPLSISLHALTAGSIGSMTLGMMARVTLGHTGRELVATTATTTIFFLIQGAILIRIICPIITPTNYTTWMIGSALLWSVCFFVYLFVYTPMLMRQRPDGQMA